MTDQPMYSEPNWEPLESKLRPEAMGDWMWMCRVQTKDGVLIEQYKHRDTRRYVNLDQEGRAWIIRIEGSTVTYLLADSFAAAYQAAAGNFAHPLS
jgi:hypothetical protein